MADSKTLPTDQELRAYMRKLKTFRDTLAPREQRMLDAVVLAAYWADESADTHGYTLLTPVTIYDENATLPPLDVVPWGKALGTI